MAREIHFSGCMVEYYFCRNFFFLLSSARAGILHHRPSESIMEAQLRGPLKSLDSILPRGSRNLRGFKWAPNLAPPFWRRDVKLSNFRRKKNYRHEIVGKSFSVHIFHHAFSIYIIITCITFQCF